MLTFYTRGSTFDMVILTKSVHSSAVHFFSACLSLFSFPFLLRWPKSTCLSEPIAYYSSYSINTTMLTRNKNKRMHSAFAWAQTLESAHCLFISKQKKTDPIQRIE